MAKIDKIKAIIDVLKFWLGIAVATLLAVAGWLVLNYDKQGWFIIAGAVVCLCACGIAIFCISRSLMRKINDLEEL